MPQPRKLPRIVRRRSKLHGFGVFAAEAITKNTRRGRTGELIRNSRSGVREARYLATGAIWVFRVDRTWSRDAAVDGNIARFINHACKPNCWFQVVDKTIWIRASRSIRAGEELTDDYRTEGDHTIPCRCLRPAARRSWRRPPRSARAGGWRVAPPALGRCRQQLGQQFAAARDERDPGLAVEQSLGLQHLEQRRRDLRVLAICWSASPTICGRIAAALANSIAACRSAVLVMMLTWLAPSCLIAEVTWRRRLTTFSSICRIMPASRKWTLRM